MDRLWDLVEVSVSSDEEVKGQGQLSEGATGHAFNERFVINFEETIATCSREPDHMPLVESDRSSAPETILQPLHATVLGSIHKCMLRNIQRLSKKTQMSKNSNWIITGVRFRVIMICWYSACACDSSHNFGISRKFWTTITTAYVMYSVKNKLILLILPHAVAV